MAAEPTKEADSSKTEQQNTDGEKKDGEKPAGAPEKYEAFKVPDGQQIDEKVVEAATPIFKELNLTQDQAQKLVDFYNTQNKEAAEAGDKVFRELNDRWRGEVIKDATIGNGKDGLSPAVSKAIGNAINSLGTESAAAFRDVLDKTGIGNNPAFIRGLYGMVKDMGEGTHAKPGGVSPEGTKAPNAPRTAAQAMYPGLPSAASAT